MYILGNHFQDMTGIKLTMSVSSKTFYRSTVSHNQLEEMLAKIYKHCGIASTINLFYTDGRVG